MIAVTEIENPGAKLAVDVKEAAQRLSVSPGSIRKLIRARRLSRIGGIRKILVPVASLQNFVSESINLAE
jgi:hypothetical protein